MSLIFSFSEGIRGMTKARLATIVSISSITVTIILIGLFIVFSINLHNWIDQVRQKIEMEAFLKIDVKTSQMIELEKKLVAEKGIDSVKYISKEDAAKRFKQEFGEDVLSLLEFNPFPASFTIYIENAYRSAQGAKSIKLILEQYQEIDEVVYQEPLLLTIDRYINIIYMILIITSLLIITIAITLINNTIRLTIYARRDIIQIMRLVGATEGFVRRPFLIEGIMQGVIGALIASFVIFYLVKIIKILFLPYILFDTQIILGLVVFGFFIGMISSYISVGKYMRNI
jgi:cell division transport system permease protein